MNIDIYTHFFPKPYADAIVRYATRRHPDVPDIGVLMRMFPGLCDLDLRIPHMDEFETALQVLTPIPIPIELFAGDGPQFDLMRIANDAMAESVASNPRRFVGVALLCFENIDQAIAELERTVLRLGMKGAMIFTNIQGKPLDLPALFPLYAKAIELDVPLWIHPISWDYYPWVRDYLIWQIFGWPIDTTLAMARLVYAGVMEKFPAIKFITHHAGGAVPYLLGRVIDTHDQNEELIRLSGGSTSGDSFGKSPVDYFRMFYGDTALSGLPSAMQSAHEMFGSNRLVFGSDYPFGPDAGRRFIRTNLAAVSMLDLHPEERTKILSENANSLLKLDAEVFHP